MLKNLLIIIALLLVLGIAVKGFAKTIVLHEANTVSLRGPVTDSTVNEISNQILALNQTLPRGKAIILFLDTPGGSISAGNRLIELISGLSRKVVTVSSFAASMGYQIVQSAGHRFILESGTLMSHRASISGLAGQVPGEANSRLGWISQKVEELEIRTAKRLGMSVSKYKELIRDELWLTGHGAVKKNHADEVVSVSCHTSLQGTQESTVNTLFGPARIKLHKCPLISGPLSVDVDNDDQFVINSIKREVEAMFSRTGGLWTL